MNGLLTTVRSKLLATFIACVTLILAVGLIGAYGLNLLSKNMTAMYQDNTVPILDLGKVDSSILRARLELRKAAESSRDPEATKDGIAHMREYITQAKAGWSDYYPGRVSDSEERGVADAANAALTEFIATSDALAEALTSARFDEAFPMFSKFNAIDAELASKLKRDMEINAKQTNDFVTEAHNTFVLLMWASGLSVGLGAILVLVAYTMLSRAVNDPLRAAVALATQISDGHLENEITISTKDEFSHLLRALLNMDASLTRIVTGIVASSNSITIASREIAMGNMDLSSRTEQQAASLEETAASMEELTTVVKHNADRALHANTLSKDASTLSLDARKAVSSMQSTMLAIKNSSDRIAEITAMIDSIAFQTNILALNAAVEAARAGEQGKGFAVVASEVRSLAQRAAGAAKDIKALIESASGEVRSGAEQAGRVGVMMSEVGSSIDQVAEIISEISSASEEQSHGIEQVNKAVSQMDEVTQQNAALVEQASAAAQALENQAVEQKGAVSFFSMANAGRAATAMPLARA
jgi:methyl-accepting chemotaxis protein